MAKYFKQKLTKVKETPTEVVYTYTMEDALEDGIFVDCTKIGVEAGLLVEKLVLTSRLYNDVYFPSYREKAVLDFLLGARDQIVTYMLSPEYQEDIKIGRTPLVVWENPGQSSAIQDKVWITLGNEAKGGKPSISIYYPEEY